MIKRTSSSNEHLTRTASEPTVPTTVAKNTGSANPILRPPDELGHQPPVELTGPTPREVDAASPSFPQRGAGEFERLAGADFVSEIAATLSPKTSKLLDGAKDSKALGAQVGRAIAELAASLRRSGYRDPASLTILDELIGIALFARRAGQADFVTASNDILGVGELDCIAAEVRAVLPGEILAVVVGAGGMGVGLSQLMGHGIRPGGHSWRSRLIIASPFEDEWRPINERGAFEPGSRAHGRVPTPINFAGGPQIEAIALEAIDQVLPRARMAMLMVPSAVLPAVVEEIVPHLSPDTPVVEFTKGLTPKSHQLPREYIASALSAAGLADRVPVVSLGGFVPAQQLHHGDEVRIAVLSKSEAAAAEVRGLLTGNVTGQNPYVEALVDDHPMATELAGALKNVVALAVGMRAVDRTDADVPGGPGAAALKLIERLIQLALPGSDGVDELLSVPVRTDVVACCGLEEYGLRQLLALAEIAQIPDEAAAIAWINHELLPHRTEIAPTRNVIVGVIAGLVKMWGPDLELEKVLAGINLTAEGVASLVPLAGWLATRDVEIPAELDEIYARFGFALDGRGPG